MKVEEMITIYGLHDCAQCNSTKTYLDKQTVPYEYVNLGENRDAKKLVYKKGVKKLPLVVIRDQNGNEVDFWSGFNITKMLEIVG